MDEASVSAALARAQEEVGPLMTSVHTQAQQDKPTQSQAPVQYTGTPAELVAPMNEELAVTDPIGAAHAIDRLSARRMGVTIADGGVARDRFLQTYIARRRESGRF